MSMARAVFAIGAAACAALLPAWTEPASGRAPEQAAGPPSTLSAPADGLYFPPADGPWETVDPAAAGWDAAGLDAALALAGDRDSTGGALIPAAPVDLVAAQGARDRKLYVVPSLNLVVSRLGDDGSREGSSFNDAFWERLVEAAPGP